MTEMPTEFKGSQEMIGEIGRLKILSINFLYFWTLFFINVGVIMLYDQWLGIDFNSVYSVVIVATIFTVVTLTDVVLISKEKVTPTLLVWVIAVSPFLVLYKLFKDADLFSLNRISTPAKIKKYVFPWQIA